MIYYTVKYSGRFAFIKPHFAVRDVITYSQKFLTPSIVEGIRLHLNVKEILRHKLLFSGCDFQQETVEGLVFKGKGSKTNERYKNIVIKDTGIIKRAVLINPVLYLAFSSIEDAKIAFDKHILLCRNEDLLLPIDEIKEMDDKDFNNINGYELIFSDENNEDAEMVGFNKFKNYEKMYGIITIPNKND